MREIRLHHILVAVLLGHALGCGPSASSPAAPNQPEVAETPAADPAEEPQPLSDQQARAIVERSAEHVRSLAQALAGALDGPEPDCTRVADRARPWLATHRRALRQARGDALKIPEHQRAELMRRSLAGDRDVIAALAALTACRDHPDMADVTDGLESP